MRDVRRIKLQCIAIATESSLIIFCTISLWYHSLRQKSTVEHSQWGDRIQISDKWTRVARRGVVTLNGRIRFNDWSSSSSAVPQEGWQRAEHYAIRVFSNSYSIINPVHSVLSSTHLLCLPTDWTDLFPLRYLCVNSFSRLVVGEQQMDAWENWCRHT